MPSDDKTSHAPDHLYGPWLRKLSGDKEDEGVASLFSLLSPKEQQEITDDGPDGPVGALYRTALEAVLPRTANPAYDYAAITLYVEELSKIVDDSLYNPDVDPETLCLVAASAFFVIPLSHGEVDWNTSRVKDQLYSTSIEFAKAARTVIFNPPQPPINRYPNELD